MAVPSGAPPRGTTRGTTATACAATFTCPAGADNGTSPAGANNGGEDPISPTPPHRDGGGRNPPAIRARALHAKPPARGKNDAKAAETSSGRLAISPAAFHKHSPEQRRGPFVAGAPAPGDLLASGRARGMPPPRGGTGPSRSFASQPSKSSDSISRSASARAWAMSARPRLSGVKGPQLATTSEDGTPGLTGNSWLVSA